MYPRIVIQSLDTIKLSWVCKYTEGITQRVLKTFTRDDGCDLSSQSFSWYTGFHCFQELVLSELFYHPGRNSLNKKERKKEKQNKDTPIELLNERYPESLPSHTISHINWSLRALKMASIWWNLGGCSSLQNRVCKLTELENTWKRKCRLARSPHFSQYVFSFVHMHSTFF